MKTIKSVYFYGNKVSNYGIENGFVDYSTLAKSFNAVLNNDIISKTLEIGFWESENEEYCEDSNGVIYSPGEASDRIDELNEELDTLDEENNADRIQEINEDIEALEDSKYHDIFQYYIVDDNGAEILKEAGEIVFYNEVLDMYVWGVTHWGTSWDYVLTNIKIEK